MTILLQEDDWTGLSCAGNYCEIKPASLRDVLIYDTDRGYCDAINA